MKSYSFHYLGLLITLSVIGFPLQGLTDESLDTVHVNGTASENLSAYDFIGSHTQVDLSSYENEFIELSHILNGQAGIDTQSLSGVGQYSTAFIRGAEGQQVLVFEDGVPLNDLNGSGADIGSISLNNVSSISIYRGFVPMELSATAIGGAIDIQTNQQKNTLGYAKINLGSYGTQQVNLKQGFVQKNISGSLQYDNSRSDNDFIYEESQPTVSPSTPRNEPRYNNGASRKILATTLNYEIDSNERVFIKTSYKNTNREISAKINSPNNHTNISLDEYNFISTYTHANYSTSYTLKKSSEVFDDREDKVGLGEQHNKYDSKFHKINVTYNKKIDGLNIFINQQGQTEVLNTYYLNIPKSSTSDCQDIEKCDTRLERSQLNSGVRLQWDPKPSINTNFQFVQSWTKDTGINDDNNFTFSSIFSGLSYKPVDNITFSSSLSRQVRIPSTNELFGDRGTTLGNPDLKPEKSNSIEVGVESYYRHSQFSFYLFQRDIEDNISGEQDNRGVIKYSNIAKTRFNGAEFSFDMNLNHYISYLGNATYQKGTILDNNLESTIDNEINNHRNLAINHSAILSMDNWTSKLTHRHQKGGYYTIQNEENLAIPEQNTIDLSISKKIWLTTISFKAINVTNQRIQDFPYSPVSGRTYYLTINQKWDL